MKMRKAIALAGVSASLALMAGAPRGFAAQKWGSTDSPTKYSQSWTDPNAYANTNADRAFAREAAEGGMAEVKLGQLAEEKGMTPAVKDFGKRIVTDHSKADDQLKTAASTDEVTLPSNLNAKDQAEYDRLSQLSGTAFDKAYAHDMVRDHEMDIRAFQREAKDGKDAAIKNFASQTVPTLEDHLKVAREMRNSVSAMKQSS